MRKLIARVRAWLRGTAVAEQPPPAQPNEMATADDGMLTDAEALQRLMHLLEQTEEGEYSCRETFDLLDEYVELVTDEAEAAALMPYVRRHLAHCNNCRERYEALLRILETT